MLLLVLFSSLLDKPLLLLQSTSRWAFIIARLALQDIGQDIGHQRPPRPLRPLRPSRPVLYVPYVLHVPSSTSSIRLLHPPLPCPYIGLYWTSTSSTSSTYYVLHVPSSMSSTSFTSRPLRPLRLLRPPRPRPHPLRLLRPPRPRPPWTSTSSTSSTSFTSPSVCPLRLLRPSRPILYTSLTTSTFSLRPWRPLHSRRVLLHSPFSTRPSHPVLCVLHVLLFPDSLTSSVSMTSVPLSSLCLLRILHMSVLSCTFQILLLLRIA